MANDIDLSKALNSIIQNPIPWGTIIIAGLHLIIPILGPITLLGWQRRIYEESQQGTTHTIPNVRFLDDLQYGIQPLIAVLNSLVVIIAFFVLMFVLFGCGGLGGIIVAQVSQQLAAVLVSLGAIVLYGVYIFGGIGLSLGLNVINLELQRRGNNGDIFPISQYREILWLLRHHTKAYFLTFVGILLAGLLSSVGIFFCCVGVFFTVPLSMIVSARILSQ